MKLDTNTLLMIIIAILLPPVAVFLNKGVGKDLAINLVCCLLFWVPGIVHAVWLITRK